MPHVATALRRDHFTNIKTMAAVAAKKTTSTPGRPHIMAARGAVPMMD